MDRDELARRLWEQVREHTWDRIDSQTGEQVGNRVWNGVWLPLERQVGGREHTVMNQAVEDDDE